MTTKRKDEPASAVAALQRLQAVPDSQCSCKSCQGMCERHPCWPTPAEALAIINAGLGDRLNVDWWVGSPLEGHTYTDDDVNLLAPARVGYEGGCSASWPAPARCTFLDGNGRCELHSLGLKPAEGRKAIHEPEFSKLTEDIHRLVAATWASDEYQEIVRSWREPRGV